ncbi:hypothetical protein C0Q70_03531 [Pomacea canaliculata]|uniref:G-protein coupled receptors family 1 profile domain-containing protein n=1 Tax=Pomacea canaliculata TaxID=400727 RepID=A0A2T7PSZ5_POMCA|nr:hypothetical protein C0Q70_03531 [Pomacea canaliculata]
MSLQTLNHTSNWTEAEVVDYLNRLSLQAWTNRMPVVLYLSILMAVGILDNIFTFLVYHRRYRPSSTRVFVMSMSLCDLLVNVVGIPLQITTIRYAYNSFDLTVCRMFYVFATIPTQASGFYLILVAYDRYRHICHPFSRQLSAGQTWRLVAAASVLALVLFLPFTPFYGWHSVDSPLPGVKAVMCWIHDPFRSTVYPKVYTAVVALTFFLGVIFITVFYLLIGVHVFQHQLKMKRIWSNQKDNRRKGDGKATANICKTERQARPSPGGRREQTSEQLKQVSASTISIILMTSTSSGVAGGVVDDVAVVDSYERRRFDVNEILQPPTNPCERSGRPASGGCDGSEMDRTRSQMVDKEGKVARRRNLSREGQCLNKNGAIRSRTTLIMAIVTGFYIANWLPHLLMRLTSDSPSNMCDHFTDCGLNMHGLTLRSYYINSAVNAFVYCFCSPKFRQQCRLLLARKPRFHEREDWYRGEELL